MLAEEKSPLLQQSPVENCLSKIETPEPEGGHDGYRFYTRFEAYREDWVEEITMLKKDESHVCQKGPGAFSWGMKIPNTNILIETF